MTTGQALDDRCDSALIVGRATTVAKDGGYAETARLARHRGTFHRCRPATPRYAG